MKKYLPILLLLLLAQSSQAQIIQDYFFKNWDLSFVNPAALTQTGGLKGNLQYSRNVLGSVNTSTSGLLQLHSDIGSKHGIGVIMQNQRSGILTGTGIGAGYGYKLALAQNQTLAAGARFNYFKYNINRAEVTNANVSDPVLFGDIYQQNSLLVSTGLLYEWDKLQVAITAPELLPLENTSYYKRNFDLYAGYTIELGDVNLRPNIYYENLDVLGGRYEAGIFTSYKQIGNLEVAYTSQSALRVKAGVAVRSFELGYGFDAGNTGQSDEMNKVGHHLFLAYKFGNILLKSKLKREVEQKELENMEVVLKENTRLIEDSRKVIEQAEETQKQALEELKKSQTATYNDFVKEGKANEPVAAVLDNDQSTAGFYIAIASFSTMKQANIYINERMAKGFTPKVMYNTNMKKYRVYLRKFDTFPEASKWKNKFRKNGFKDAWIFQVE